MSLGSNSQTRLQRGHFTLKSSGEWNRRQKTEWNLKHFNILNATFIIKKASVKIQFTCLTQGDVKLLLLLSLNLEQPSNGNESHVIYCHLKSSSNVFVGL